MNKNPYNFDHSKSNQLEALGASPGDTTLSEADAVVFANELMMTKTISQSSELIVKKILEGDILALSIITFLVLRGLMPPDRGVVNMGTIH